MVLLKSDYEILKKGDKAPDFKLIGTDGKIYSLSSFKQKLVLIIFMCNHCPYVLAKMDEINNLSSEFKGKVAVIGINPNDSDDYLEDSFENMKKIKHEFYYLHDATQMTARDYGAVCTPDPYLFNERRELVYHGRLDDAPSPEMRPKAREMKDIIEDVLSGKNISKEHPSMGCSIKWKKDSFMC